MEGRVARSRRVAPRPLLQPLPRFVRRRPVLRFARRPVLRFARRPVLRFARRPVLRFARRPVLRFARRSVLRFARRSVRPDRTVDLRARGNASRGIALTLSPGVPATRCGPVPPRTGHDVIAPDAHTPTVPS